MENELVVQVSMKQEMELAMKLLEKDIHEKQVRTFSPLQRRDKTRVQRSPLTGRVQAQSVVLYRYILRHKLVKWRARGKLSRHDVTPVRQDTMTSPLGAAD